MFLELGERERQMRTLENRRDESENGVGRGGKSWEFRKREGIGVS